MPIYTCIHALTLVLALLCGFKRLKSIAICVVYGPAYCSESKIAQSLSFPCLSSQKNKIYLPRLPNFSASQSVKKIIEINPYMLGTLAGGAADCQFWHRNLGIKVVYHFAFSICSLQF